MTEQERTKEAEVFDKAIEVYEPQDQQAISPLDLPPESFALALERRKANWEMLMGWIRESLIKGTDFGSITIRGQESKPSLWKPGAEKICNKLGITPTWPSFSKYEDRAIEGAVIENIIIKCEGLNSAGQIVAEGIGARIVSKDGGDLNKALKMAKKSSHIDMTLSLASISEVFTQDLEDMKFKDSTPTPEEAAKDLPEVPEGTDTTAPKPETPGKTDFEKQQQLYNLLVEICGTEDTKVLSAELEELTGFPSGADGDVKKETSPRKLKGKGLHTAIGKAKAKLGPPDAKKELLHLLDCPALSQELADEYRKEADDKRHKEQWYKDQIVIVKGLIADAEKPNIGREEYPH